MNDYNDQKADAVNKRKGNYLFGAISSKEQLKELPKKIIVVILPFIIYFTYLCGLKMLLLLAFMVIINIMYNFYPFRIKERPPFEILIQVGYVATAIFSVLLNNQEALPWQTLFYLSLFAFQAHIAGEIMDIEPDIKAKKKTTATLIGRKNAKFLMLAILIIESLILLIVFEDIVLSGFLTLFSIWLVLDIFIFFKERPYTVKQMKLFGFAMNFSAIFSMIWVLYSGKLLHPVF